jgi:Ca2+-binding EF-hand superfamily protein
VSNFRTLDKNADGALTARELDRFETVARRVDTNNDGKISSAEYQSACASGILRDRDIKS